ncbi:MAG: HAD family phosphatase [Actinobacteria bacterium]|nr:HAD family phosphatase [Actinomycetota bacterium]
MEAVFFDFGGVFISSPFAAAAEAARQRGIPEDELLELVFGPYDLDGDHPWHRLERGELSFADTTAAIAELAAAAGHQGVDPMDVLMALATERSVRDFMVDLVRDLRSRGLATGIITNNIAEFGEAWRAMIPVDELFDDIVDSSAVGLRKPNPAIYLLACERLGVAPEAALFIDDHEGNVAGARAVGMGAVWCGLSVETTRAAADELLALVGSTATT